MHITARFFFVFIKTLISRDSLKHVKPYGSLFLLEMSGLEGYWALWVAAIRCWKVQFTCPAATWHTTLAIAQQLTLVSINLIQELFEFNFLLFLFHVLKSFSLIFGDSYHHFCKTFNVHLFRMHFFLWVHYIVAIEVDYFHTRFSAYKLMIA